MNAETDFVAKNEGFQVLVQELAEYLLATKPASVEEALESKMSNGLISCGSHFKRCCENR